MKDSGILDEQSDLRVHVCSIAKCIYVFPTACGKQAVERAMNSRVLKVVKAYQPSVDEPTAEGYKIIPSDINNCVCITIRDESWKRYRFSGTPSEQGAAAEKLVADLALSGLLPSGGKPSVVKVPAGTPENIAGADLVVESPKPVRIQVKLDSPGGAIDRGGSGFLFLQFKEKNPLKYT